MPARYQPATANAVSALRIAVAQNYLLLVRREISPQPARHVAAEALMTQLSTAPLASMRLVLE